MDCWPEFATGPTGVISTRAASEDVQLSCEASPQLSCAVVADSCAAGLATATVALAVPTVKRGMALSFSPRGQATVLRTPFGISTTTRWVAGTLTGPDQTSLSPDRTETWYVPGGTTSSCFHHQS